MFGAVHNPQHAAKEDRVNALVDTFIVKATAAGAEVHRCASPQQALAFLQQMLQKESAGGAALWASGPLRNRLDRPSLAESWPGLDFEITQERAAAAKVGISEVDWGIADTGTLVQNAGTAEQRLVSSLPPMHIALLASAKILPDLATALLQVESLRRGCAVLITGPSRTADIERVLTIGVHGPGRLIVILFDETEAA